MAIFYPLWLREEEEEEKKGEKGKKKKKEGGRLRSDGPRSTAF